MIKNNTLRFIITILTITAGFNIHAAYAEPAKIPNFIGTWSGENHTYSDKKGYRTWAKIIKITEQNGRIFRGTFTYADGTKNFFGVIYPDNKSFTWVAVNSKGYNQGRIHDDDNISACYVEAWEEATVGCTELKRQPTK